MAIKNEKPIGKRVYSWEWVTNWPFRRWLRLYDTKWQDALDVKHNLFQNNAVILMLLPGEKWFCVATFNNLELKHDLEWGRGKGADRQDWRKQWWWGMAWGMERWHEDKQEETRELKRVTNVTLNPDMLAGTPSFSLFDKYKHTLTWGSTEKVCLTSVNCSAGQCHFTHTGTTSF